MRLLDDAADVGLEVRADSAEQLFATAGRALMEWMGPPPATGAAVTLDVKVDAEDIESLLVKWLRDSLFLFYQEHAYFLGARRLSLSDTGASAQADFRLWEDAAYRDYQEIKAITYHQLRVVREGDSWRARVILDI